MEHKVLKTRNCPFCGKEIQYYLVEEDGSDWLGHHRGSSKSYITDNTCECEKRTYKRGCFNCKFNVSGECSNEDIVKEIEAKVTGPFTVKIESATITNLQKCCRCWELTPDIQNYFKPI